MSTTRMSAQQFASAHFRVICRLRYHRNVAVSLLALFMRLNDSKSKFMAQLRFAVIVYVVSSLRIVSIACVH